MLIRYVEIVFCVAQRKSAEIAAQVSCIRLPALQPATLFEAAEKRQNNKQTRMTTPIHNLLDQLMNEVKKNLVDEQIEKMKTEILNVFFLFVTPPVYYEYMIY